MRPGHLAWFADARSLERTARDERLRHHHRRSVRKASGEARLIEAPKQELKDLQRQVLHGILDRIPPHPAADGRLAEKRRRLVNHLRGPTWHRARRPRPRWPTWSPTASTAG